MSWADASEGIFTSAYGNSGAYRQSVLPDEHYRGDNAEVEFLKREVLDLERVIKSLHSSRTEDRYALEEADQRAAAIDAEAQQWRAAHECKLHEAQEALRGVRAEHAVAGEDDNQPAPERWFQTRPPKPLRRCRFHSATDTAWGGC